MDQFNYILQLAMIMIIVPFKNAVIFTFQILRIPEEFVQFLETFTQIHRSSVLLIMPP